MSAMKVSLSRQPECCGTELESLLLSTAVTVTLPDEVLRRAELLARHAGRPLTDLLAETIELSLGALGGPGTPGKSLADCSDEEVLSTADATLPVEDDERLSALLHRQQAGLLSGSEPAELLRLLGVR